MNRACIFIPGWGATKTTSKLFHKPLLEKLTAFNNIYFMFHKGHGINHSLTELSNLTSNYIYKNELPQKHDSITFIGYSIGGLIAMDLVSLDCKWTKAYSISDKTDSIITIASPHNGADKLKGPQKNIALTLARATTDVIPNSHYLKRYRQWIQDIKPIPTLALAAEYDRLISQKSATSINADKTVINNAFHLNVVLKKQTHQEINHWYANKVLNANWNYLTLTPEISFIDLSQELG